MKRRVLLLASLATLPSAALAQPEKPRRIGFLMPGEANPFVANVRDDLRRLGHVEGRTIRIDVRAAVGQQDRLPALAAELVALDVDVIVAYQTPSVSAAMAATRTIPIVMSAGDPVRMGIVASLARPGGNVTGMSGTSIDLSAKLLSLVREALDARRIGVLANAGDPFTGPFVEMLEASQGATGVSLHIERVPAEADYGDTFAAFKRAGVRAVVVQPSLRARHAIAQANAQRLPTASPLETFTAAGGVLAYGASRRQVERTLARYVDRVLKGAKPADLPVEQPTEYLLNVNLKAAKALGIELPLSIITRADTVIE